MSALMDEIPDDFDVQDAAHVSYDLANTLVLMAALAAAPPDAMSLAQVAGDLRKAFSKVEDFALRRADELCGGVQ